MTVVPATSRGIKTFRALSHRNFRLWIIGLFISGIGTWMQMTAQDWTVLTALTDNDAAALSFVIALQTAPQLLLLPVAGYVSDRYPKRKVLFCTQIAMGCIAVILGALVLSGAAEYWHVCVLAVVLGGAQAFDAPARQTMVNDLVPQADLVNGIALGGATFNLARLVGPAVAGLLIGVIGAGWIFLANAFSFVAMILALILMRLDTFVPSTSTGTRSGALLGGLRYVVAHREIRVLLALMFVVVGVVGSSLNLLIITSATSIFEAGSEGFGLLTSLVAVGSVLGALFAAGRSTPRASVLFGAVVIIGASLLAAAFMPTYLAFALVMPVIGLGLMSGMSTLNALVQTMTEVEIRGRVMGIYMGAWVSGATIGAIVLGAVIEWQGSRVALGASGVACLVAVCVAAPVLGAARRGAAQPSAAMSSATGDARGDLS